MNEDREILAAEYVLGTLHADERTLFASVLAHDLEAQGAVAAWEARFAALEAAVTAIPPPPAVWERIDRALTPAEPFGVVDGALERPAPEPEKRAPIAAAFASSSASIESLRRSLARWRFGAIAAGALAAILAIFVVDRQLIRHPNVQPAYVAVVNRGGTLPALVVRVDLAKAEVYVRPISAEAPEGKSLELWYIDPGKAPKSMGVIAPKAMRTPLPAGLTPEKASFAVTVEPEGGSPTGAPTGPIVYSGQLIRE